MLKLYYFPGSYSLAAHILLEDSGCDFELQLVDLRRGEQRGDEFRKVNPRGFVPALRLESGDIITENTAILPYLGKRFEFWPADAINEARALEMIGFFATSVHAACARALHPEQFCQGTDAQAALKLAALDAFRLHLGTIDRLLDGRQWLLEQYSACDPYCFGFYTWGLRRGTAMRDFVHYTQFMDRMLERRNCPKGSSKGKTGYVLGLLSEPALFPTFK
jgi:glutathione S-transferase